ARHKSSAMKSLTDALQDQAIRRAMTVETAALIDTEVADKSGLSGGALKAGYKTIKGLKPGFIEKVVGDMLPEFGRALDPFEREAREAAQPIVPYFSANAERVANALLAITDAKAARSSNKVVK